MSENVTLQQLRYFVMAARLGSFSAVADELHVAQPSISEQIRKLEGSLGVALFTRTNRNLQLTDVARRMLPKAEAVLLGMTDFHHAVREERELEGGQVSFGTFNSAHMYLLTPLVTEFHEQHPSVGIRVIGLNSAEVADAVRSGEIEAGIVQLPVDARGLEVSTAVLTDTVVFVSRDKQATLEPMTIERLAERPLVLSEARWATEDPFRVNMSERAQRAGIKLRIRAEVEFQTAAVELAANGVGDSVASYLMVVSPQYRGRVHWAHLDPLFYERFAFVWRTGAALSPATRAFIALARKHIGRLQREADKALR
ncbi:MAG TPA: LysR family transcriptional regulator [Actinokineospora sp.]|nr:LysR family transcriptional regulator [Actinokineospora sp.]